jgi:hypothetical protein
MRNHPVLGTVSLVVGLGLGYLFVVEAAQYREIPLDWTIVLPAYFIGVFVVAGILLLLRHKAAYVVALAAWSSLSALFALFLFDPPANRDIALISGVFAAIGTSVVVYLLIRSRAAVKMKEHAV